MVFQYFLKLCLIVVLLFSQDVSAQRYDQSYEGEGFVSPRKAFNLDYAVSESEIINDQDAYKTRLRGFEGVKSRADTSYAYVEDIAYIASGIGLASWLVLCLITGKGRLKTIFMYVVIWLIIVGHNAMFAFFR